MRKLDFFVHRHCPSYIFFVVAEKCPLSTLFHRKVAWPPHGFTPKKRCPDSISKLSITNYFLNFFQIPPGDFLPAVIFNSILSGSLPEFFSEIIVV